MNQTFTVYPPATCFCGNPTVPKHINKTMTLKVVARNKTELVEFLRVCGAIQWCGRAGASRDIPVSVDGDGSGRLAFWLEDENGKPIEIPNIPEERWENNGLSIGE